eukprot:364975-Chlamydomonas_euryale.AAC.9
MAWDGSRSHVVAGTLWRSAKQRLIQTSARADNQLMTAQANSHSIVPNKQWRQPGSSKHTRALGALAALPRAGGSFWRLVLFCTCACLSCGACCNTMTTLQHSCQIETVGGTLCYTGHRCAMLCRGTALPRSLRCNN